MYKAFIFLKPLFVAVLMLLFSASFAQEKLKEVYDIDPGLNVPEEMRNVKNWIDSCMGQHMIGGLNFSQSYWGDSKSMSFYLAGKAPYIMPLPGLDGLHLTFKQNTKSFKPRSETFLAEFNTTTLIRTHKIARYKFTTLDYFKITCELWGATDEQLLANTLNYMVEDAGTKDKFDQFIDAINKKEGKDIPYQPKKTVKELYKLMKANFGDQVMTVVFDTYIKDRKRYETLRNMEQFFTLAHFPEAVTQHVDRKINPCFTWHSDSMQLMNIPVHFFSTKKDKSQGFKQFNFNHFEATLAFAARSFEVSFKGRSEGIVLDASKSISYTKKGKRKLIRYKDKRVASPAKFQEIKLTIKGKQLRLDGLSEDQFWFELFKGKWGD